MIEVLIADDHPVIRQGVKRIPHAEPDIKVADEAQNAQEALGSASKKQYDVLLMDIDMPGRSGLDALNEFRARQRVASLSWARAVVSRFGGIYCRRNRREEVLQLPIPIIPFITFLTQSNQRRVAAMKTLSFALLLTASVVFVLMGCSDNSSPVVSPTHQAINSPSPSKALAKSNGTSFLLHGAVTYYTYAVKTKEVLQNFTGAAEATLELLPGNGVRLSLNETDIGREMVLEGKLTPSGVVKIFYDWGAERLKEIIEAHTGCAVYGDFVYHGEFDGTRFLADFAFNSRCPVYWPNNDIFATPVDGPVQWKWTIDLTVND